MFDPAIARGPARARTPRPRRSGAARRTARGPGGTGAAERSAAGAARCRCSRSNCARLPVASTLRSIAFVEQLQALRDDQQHRHLELAEGPDQHRRLAADRVDDGLAGRQRREQVAGLLEHVRQRQDREEPLIRAEREDVDQRPGVRRHVAVGQHRALRVAGRARGEDDQQQVVGRDIGRRQRLGAAGRGRGATRSGSPAVRAGAPPPRSGVRRGRASARSARDLRRRSRPCCGRRAARRRARRARGQEAERPLRPVDGPDHHPVAGRCARVDQGAGDPRHLVAQVPVAPDPGAEARLDEQRRLRAESVDRSLDESVDGLHVRILRLRHFGRTAVRAPPRRRARGARRWRRRSTVDSARGRSFRRRGAASRSTDARAPAWSWLKNQLA